jgi:hypothetical protein
VLHSCKVENATCERYNFFASPACVTACISLILCVNNHTVPFVFTP